MILILLILGDLIIDPQHDIQIESVGPYSWIPIQLMNHYNQNAVCLRLISPPTLSLLPPPTTPHTPSLLKVTKVRVEGAYALIDKKKITRQDSPSLSSD